MIWLFGTLLTLCGFLLLVGPLIARGGIKSSTAQERQVYIDRINELDAQIAREPENAAALSSAKTHLERQLLQFSQGEDATASAPNWKLAGGLLAFLLIATLGIYSQIGGTKQIETAQNLEGQSLEGLVVELESKLKLNPDNVEGQMIYARSLMSLKRYDEALAAYDKAFEISGEDERITTERSQAQVYITAQNTAPEDRTAMIEGMVEGLAARLAENPNDPEGWTRLIRARLVMGDREQAARDVETVRAVFKDDAGTRDKIFSKSGWSEQ